MYDPKPVRLSFVDEADYEGFAPQPLAVVGEFPYATTQDIAEASGWGRYIDTQYTSGSPFAVTPNTDVPLPNNAGTKIETQLPGDVTSFYNPTTKKIFGREGNSGLLTVDITIVPTNSSTRYMDVWLNLGGAFPKVFTQTISFPKGANEPHSIVFNCGYYVGATWAANGAQIYVRSDNTASVYGIGYTLQRTHTAP